MLSCPHETHTPTVHVPWSTALLIQETLHAAVTETIAVHSAEVERWLVREPGAWGFLAGKAVLAARSKLGRRLSESERRVVWSMLWAELGDVGAGRAKGP